MSPRDIRGKSGVVPGGNSGSGGAVKTKPTTSFATKHDVVLMTLTGSYCHGSSSSGREGVGIVCYGFIMVLLAFMA